VIVAGPNGSGKSVLTREGRSHLAFSLPDKYINADEIAQTFLAEMPDASASDREQAAFYRARELRSRYREEGNSFAFETVLSHPSTLIDMRKSRAIGYHIVLIYVTTSDVEINVRRVADRVRDHGHDVPAEKIRSRYVRSMALLPRLIEEVDEAFVYDATDKARLCFRKYPDGRIRSIRLPHYLTQALQNPLYARINEREQIANKFGSTEAIEMPDEDTGKYIGSVSHQFKFYGIQALSFGSYCRHDLLLLTGALPADGVIEFNYNQGQSIATRAVTQTDPTLLPHQTPPSL
jgi:predicted ABC-type ATPase